MASLADNQEKPNPQPKTMAESLFIKADQQRQTLFSVPEAPTTQPKTMAESLFIKADQQRQTLTPVPETPTSLGEPAATIRLSKPAGINNAPVVAKPEPTAQPASKEQPNQALASVEALRLELARLSRQNLLTSLDTSHPSGRLWP